MLIHRLVEMTNVNSSLGLNDAMNYNYLITSKACDKKTPSDLTKGEQEEGTFLLITFSQESCSAYQSFLAACLGSCQKTS